MKNNIKVGSIKSAIEKWLNENSFLIKSYENWYVGITSDPNKRKSNHESDRLFGLSRWRSWDAGSYSNARVIEMHFGQLGKGMKGGIVKGGATSKSRFVYVFK